MRMVYVSLYYVASYTVVVDDMELISCNLQNAKNNKFMQVPI